jgi:osmotically-inducible protein OsmY/serine/threonine protein phosphatase PrpC
MSAEGSGATRGGGDDFHNEDAFLVEEGLGLFVVCDGASQSPAGEIAAHIAVDAVARYVAGAESQFGDDLWRSPESTVVVHNALRYALNSVLEAARKRAELREMSTTVTMLLVRGNQGVIGHAGDSRAYLVRHGRGHQLTRDHELTEALPREGAESFEIDTFAIHLEPRDTLILCTDGAEEVVEDPSILRAAVEASPPVLASRIVSAAHRRDSSRDATAVVVRVRGDAEPGWLDLSVPPRESSFGYVVGSGRSGRRERPEQENRGSCGAGNRCGRERGWKEMGKRLRRYQVLGTLAALMALMPIASGAERPGDAEVTNWVEEAIAADPRVRGDAIEVATRDGIVTLSGSVPTLAGRGYAVLVAQKTVGVLGVIDQLEIEASPRADSEVAAAVRSRIENSQAIRSRKLEVRSREGVVRLNGEVGSESQRFEAELLASEVAGVRGIENFLSAKARDARSDAEIEKDVAAALRRDVYLSRLPIQVTVKRGVVTLTGSVGSAYERERAGSRLRWVDGVKNVSNQLQVEWWEDRSQRVAAPTPRTDAELAATVSEQLGQDTRVAASHVQVTADRGRVSLRGNVPSLRQKRIAEEDAWNVAGVGWVANELAVVTEARPDAEISSEIRGALAADSELFDAKIEVRVEAGVVTLEGRVASGYQRTHAGSIVSRTRGVERLDNRLVSASWGNRADGELAAEVTQQLRRNWRTAELGERIRVHVEGGVVTLTGSVDRWSERRSAGRVAAETLGVRKVRNRIVVEPYPYPWKEREPAVDPEGTPDWDPYYFDHPILPWIASLDSRMSSAIGPERVS